MKSSNPVLGRLVDRSAQHAGYQRVPTQAPYGGATGFGPPGTATAGPAGYAPVRMDRMTVDDVVIRTVALLATVGITGAAAWLLVPDTGLSTMVLFGALGLGLVLGLAISFARITNPVVILTYAVIEGVLLGIISRYYEQAYSGIVLQAVAATFGVFFGMAILYSFRIIRATPTFVKWVTGAVIGVLVLMAVNFLLAVFGVNDGAGLGLRGDGSGNGSLLAIGFSLLCIGIASLTFILDFAAIEAGVQGGVERRFAWYASFGILVGLVWLYLEILRLLSYARR